MASVLLGGTVAEAAERATKLRVGSFVGLQRRTGTSREAWRILEWTDRLHVRVRPDRQRVYVTLTRPDRSSHGQSFVAKSDRSKDGVRRIVYRRPAKKEVVDAELGMRTTLTSAGGRIEIRRNGITWRDAIRGTVTLGKSEPSPMQFDTTFIGVRGTKTRTVKR